MDGNIHGGEVLGGEGALAFLERLTSRYGTEQEITELVDSRAFYVVPIVNPDGRAISVDTPENHRWNIRPVDEDGDGLMDEDPPEDLDGDGRMLQMRLLDPEGSWSIHPTDPRRMVRGDAAARPRYRMEREGIDNDGDGRFNEDRVGGVDLNRNFPANWSAAQFASGPSRSPNPRPTRSSPTSPRGRTSRPSTRSTPAAASFSVSRPWADQDFEFPRADIEEYRGIAEDGIALTGYRNFAVEKKPIVDLMSPGHGVFNDWASKVFGVLAITTEMWAHALGQGQDALFSWNDQVLGGRGFIDWYPLDHPELGRVELGGWDRWSTSSPPEPMIAAEVDRNVRWVFTFAEKTPRVAIRQASATRLAGDVIRVDAVVANVGWMATGGSDARDGQAGARLPRARKRRGCGRRVHCRPRCTPGYPRRQRRAERGLLVRPGQ